jgi:hypothetical protein
MIQAETSHICPGNALDPCQGMGFAAKPNLMTRDIAKPTTNALQAIATDGWVLFERALPNDLLPRLRSDLRLVYEKRRAVQVRNGIGEGMAGTCHHLLGEQSAMDDFIATLPLHDFVRQFFDGPYILNSFGGFINEVDGSDGYIGTIHRDVRTFSQDFRLMLNMLVMLDDFTPENGATHIMPRSHGLATKPTTAAFENTATRATGSAGDILAFDSRLWHAAGQNQTDKPRRALTLTFTRPFFKPQLDYPRFLGADYASALRPEVRQVLGYQARVPANIEEFYQPPEHRAYKSDQG